MLYQVLVDGTNILDHTQKDLVLLSPQASPELDVAGSFEFTVPPTHRYYDWFSIENIMGMTIEIIEDGVMQWFGRPIELHLDFYKNKKIYCEGGLSYFNDSVIREKEYEDTFLSDIFEAIINEHNSMVPENRQFTLGRFTVNDRPVYRKFDYEQTSDALKSKFLDAEEGHFFVRRENGVNIIDFLREMPYTCNQQVEFSENLLDFTYSFDAKDFATCVIPIGGRDESTDEVIDISSVNGGSDILVGSAASVYGNIVKVQHYSDIKNPSELLEEGQKYLTNLQYNALIIECSAVDLHSLDNSQQQFRVGQNVHCISVPHVIETDLPISKMIIYLDSAKKEITLGTIPKKTLSRFYKQEIADRGDYDYDYGGGGIDDGWQIVPPEESGGTPTMRKVPTNIAINNPPSIKTYEQGSTINFGGLSIKLLTPVTNQGPLELYTDVNYPTGIITYPSNELILPVKKVLQQTPQIKIPVQWRCPYTGQLLVNYFTITNATAAAIYEEHGGAPDHIEAFITKLGGVDPQIYRNGDRIHMNGVKVYAYWPDGTRYDANGYEDGYIPITEISYTPKTAATSSGGTYPDGPGIPVDDGNGVTVLAVTFYQKITSWGYDFIINPDTIIYSDGGGSYIGVGGRNPPRTMFLTNYQGTTYMRMTDATGPSYFPTLDYRIFPANKPNYSEIASHIKNGWYATSHYYDLVPESTSDPTETTSDDFPQKMTITLSWKSPEGDTLETAIYVTVKPYQEGSGR